MHRETHALAPGTLIAGDFRVVRLLAEGGMGAVYVVDQLSTGNQRALKIIREEYLKDAKTVERFQQEARVSARIPSDHVVQVLGAGVDPATRMPFMVMELLQGETLFTRVISRGPIDVASAIELFEQLAHALGAAHGIGVIHRDLKPENVFLARGRRARGGTLVKVLDFGVAKVLAEARTLATSAIGTPAWMAPEQTELRSTVTPATDVWALGLLAFFVLTGKYFWRACNEEGAGVNVLMRELLFEPLPSASERARALGVGHLVPHGFDEFFAKCLARDPGARFQDVASAEAMLLSLLEESPASQGVRRGGTLSDPDPHENQRTSTEPGFVDYALPAKGSTVMSGGPPPGVSSPRPSAGNTEAGEPPLVIRGSHGPVQRVSIPGPSRPFPAPAVDASTGGPPIRSALALVPPPPPRSARKKKGLEPMLAIPIALVVASVVAVLVYRAAIAKPDPKDKTTSKKDEDGETIPLPNKKTAAATGGVTVTGPGQTAPPPPPQPPKPVPRVSCSQAPAKIFLADDFRDASGGWMLDEPWQIGPAMGGQIGKAGTGWPDPDKDRQGAAGGRIAGVALGGNYKLVPGLKALTSPSFDASGAGRIVLQYHRFLNCDEGGFVPHGVEVSSDDGASWKQVWRNGLSPVADKQWVLQTHDLSKHASSKMRVRFFYQVINMEAFTASGWNLDDVVVASSECF